MRNALLLSLTASFIAPALVSSAMADEKKEHFDIWIRIVDDAVVTGSITEGTPGKPLEENARVFSAELGEDPKFPFAAFEPGFQTLPGPETAGAIFGFSVPAPVEAWTGGGFGPTDATMTLAFGPASIETAGGPVEGFSFSVTESGLFHEHFDFILNGAKGADPATGIYLLPMRLVGVSPVYAESNTFWIVFNNGEDEELHAEAIRYAELYLACGLDLDGDGSVGAKDLAVLLGAWGTGDSPQGDLDGDGAVGSADLAILLGGWGHICPE